MAEIQMPQLGETVTEGTITKWLKAVGDEISEDEAIVEVSTDKVDSEIPSPVSGTITEIRVAEGDTVEVGAVLAVVGDAGAAPDAAEAAAPTEPSAAEPPAAQDPAPEAPAPPAPAPEAAPEPAPAPAATEAPAPGSGSEGGGELLSPVVRRLINDNGLDPAAITGTGLGGRITRSDVMAVIEGRGASAPSAAPAAPAPATPAPAASAAPAPAPAARPSAPVRPPTAGEASTSVPFNNIRRRTGEHMVRSMATSPHVYTVMEADLENVDRVRKAHKEAFKAETGANLTFLPFITRALVDAIGEFPHMNASVGDGELIVHHDINVGFAVDLGHEGLIVPVVHGTHDLRLPAIARAIADVADRARARKLSADDITGGTVTITNPGASGTLMQMSVINQPQVMILSTEGVTRRPVVVTDAMGGESIAIRSMANLTMSWDHRAFDGAYAAAFLRRLVDILETRDWEAEL